MCHVATDVVWLGGVGRDVDVFSSDHVMRCPVMSYQRWTVVDSDGVGVQTIVLSDVPCGPVAMGAEM